LNNQEKISLENVLIIGGGSSVADEIYKLFEESSMQVISSFYNKQLKNNTQKNNIYLDLTNEESINNFACEIQEKLKKIDILIFLAGILPGRELKDYDFKTIDEVMETNFIGQAKLILKILSTLTSNSRILLFSSISAQKGSFDPIYAASKGALLSFVKSMVSRIPKGARINAVACGLIQDSAMFYSMSKERQEFHRSQIPSQQFLLQADLAKIIFDLCQSHWAQFNGACLDLNGGEYVR
jgi:3-oxoacyl-[acyl-carrier protein] reductase